ncbi:MAG: transcriptional regulator [Bacillus thermozeamaize]|uniref:Transcriptional regulator n=1 Tax=Bacillus thermozeamaize TaxID=230954 RepID=A0A1Y3PMX7_9BACI|nr:MAG: transcriptional regulator [Bacillus thermozeamaize]
MQQFELPELDRKKTKEAVENALRTYRLYKYLTFEEREPVITPRYELAEGGRSNRVSDQTAAVAIHNVDGREEHERRRRYCERIERAVSRLPRMERFLIEERYMCQEADYITDYHVYNFKFQPPISQPTYAKIRWRAFYRLALSLNIAVVKGDGEDAT